MNEHPALHRLIYISSASGDAAKIDLGSILAAARRNNTAAHVTGLLLFHDGCFLQVLEGERAVLDRIFASISGDPRHTGVIVLESKSAKTRGFPNWSMGFVGSHALRPEQRDWLVDLKSRIGADTHEPLSSVERVNLHVETFLSGFREFEAA